jgi:NAD(P)-dependent dehydrogenase (short-subunit alcohol dehydrogenase family)
MSHHDPYELNGQVAVVVGGTGELCGAMAEGLAAAGVKVALVGRSREKAEARLEKIQQAGGEAIFLAAEATSKGDYERVRDEVLAKWDRIDILVNGAGVNSPTPFLEIGEEEIDRILGVNYKSVVFGCQIFGKYFLESQTPGSIINLGSISGLKPLSRVFTYSASKAAVHNLSKNLAREWAVSGIRVNTLVPGFFPAEQNRKVLTEDRVASILGHTPAKRFGEAHELVGATLLLASHKAGSFITGTEMIVDGGFSSMFI